MGITEDVAEDVDQFTKDWDATLTRLITEFPAEWSIGSYKGHSTRDGVAWVANLRLNGKVVGHLEDAGRGGSIDIDFWDTKGGGRNVEAAKAWKDAIAKALPEEKFEPEALVVEALLLRAGK